MNRRGFFGRLVAAVATVVAAPMALVKVEKIPPLVLKRVPITTLSEVYLDTDEAMLNRYYAKWFARFEGPEHSRLLICEPECRIEQLK